MKKVELEQQNRILREKCERLARFLRSTQARALGSTRFLEQALQADGTCEEVGSEQVARCEEAIKQALAYLARIIDPAAQTQDQADQTVLQLREKELDLNDALVRYIADVLREPVSDVLTFIEKAMAQAMGKIALYTDDPDELCDIAPLTEAWVILCEAVALAQGAYHGNGSRATALLASLIEAAEELIANMCDSGEAYDDHEQEKTYGQIYPDVQRLHAATALAKKYLAEKGGMFAPTYQMPYPDGSGRTIAVHSLDEFADAVLKLCAIRFASHECHDDLQEALERGTEFENRVDFIGTTVDMLIPDEKEPDELLAFVAFNQAFFTEAPEHYAYSNSLAPAAIAYEQIYQYAFSLIEDNLDKILQRATHLLAERQRLEEHLTTMNQCDACGQELWAWFWDPFASVNPLLFIVPEKTKVPVGAFAIGERCKQRLEEGETLSFTFGGQHYQASAIGVIGQ